MPQVMEVAVPPASKIRQAVREIHFCDAYQAPLTRVLSAEEAYQAVFSQMPGWARGLMKVRGWAVYAFGLKHPTQADYREGEESLTRPSLQVGQRAGIFTVQSIEPQELIVGEDDKHLDFRVSVYKSEQKTVTVTTVVHIHNLFGRIYIALIKPFHKLIVRTMVQNAVDAGRL